jgi:hypothetical protein
LIASLSSGTLHRSIIMNDRTTPNADPSPDHNPPPPDPIEMNGGGYRKLWLLIAGFGALAILIIAILLPVLGAVRRAARSMNNTLQVRDITHGLETFAKNNEERCPGINSEGFIIRDNVSNTGNSGHGATVEARYWLMLDTNTVSGEYLISPAETKTVWTTDPVTADHYSYALLNIHSDADPLPNDKTRPDQIGRASFWWVAIGTQPILISDRARVPGGRIGDDYDKIYSVHTSEDSETWEGSIGRGDGSASFETKDTIDTWYRRVSRIKADRLFAKEQHPDPDTDKLTSPNAAWDDTANALLGYTSVGYEDGDIASE